jgi:2-oxoglutarate dehydrogenase E1 component
MIPETDTDMVPDDKIRKLLLCSGKVYYELRQHRNTVLKDKSVAIVRVEQLHPFPWTQMAQTIAKYPNAEVCWVQEEPKNMGAWSFVYFHIKTTGRKVRGESFEPQYAGRASAASPATASYDRHKMEIDHFMGQAFGK